jgi:hypothetical protein
MGDSPEADVTVGDSHVVGDAPPSDGTGVDLVVNPPAAGPTPPG